MLIAAIRNPHHTQQRISCVVRHSHYSTSHHVASVSPACNHALVARKQVRQASGKVQQIQSQHAHERQSTRHLLSTRALRVAATIAATASAAYLPVKYGFGVDHIADLKSLAPQFLPSSSSPSSSFLIAHAAEQQPPTLPTSSTPPTPPSPDGPSSPPAPPLLERLMSVSTTVPFGLRVGIFCALLGAFGAFNVATIPWFLPMTAKYGRIPYAPSSADHIAAIFTLLDRQQRKQSEEQPEVIAARRTKDSCVFTDLGSGDGRVVIAAAQKGFWAQGVELNYWLTQSAKRKAKAAGFQVVETPFTQKTLPPDSQLTNPAQLKVHLGFGDLFGNECDELLARSNVVYVCVGGAQVGPTLQRIKNKLERVANGDGEGTLVLSNHYRIPGWEPLDSYGDIWLYRIRHEPEKEEEEEE